MQAAINPTILFPPLYSIFPEDNKDAPTNDKTIAAKVTIDFFSLKKTAIVTATASGYIKWNDRSNTTCNILDKAMTRLNEVSARSKLSPKIVLKFLYPI